MHDRFVRLQENWFCTKNRWVFDEQYILKQNNLQILQMPNVVHLHQ